MRAFQREAGFRAVIEILRVEAHYRNPCAVMLHVAAGAVGLARRAVIRARMIARLGGDSSLDLHMTIQALESTGSGAEIVTGDTTGDAVQLRMRMGQRTRRDLSIR